jgi:PKHD-type hydroxylase
MMNDEDLSPMPFVYTFPNIVVPLESGIAKLDWKDGQNPFNSSHTLALNEALAEIQFRHNALTPQECLRAISIGNSLVRADSPVEIGSEIYRVGHVAWIEPNEETKWLFHKVGILFSQAVRHYGFELTGLIDPLQYIVCEEDQHFDWHCDIGKGVTSSRKLSLTIQLSADDEYVGGELQFVNAPSGKGRGAATFYPSYMAHRVAPVVLGVRRSLVAWACGPAFR